MYRWAHVGVFSGARDVEGAPQMTRLGGPIPDILWAVKKAGWTMIDSPLRYSVYLLTALL